MVRRARSPQNGQPKENVFYAVDPLTGKPVSTCIIYVDRNPNLYPGRPLQIRLAIDGDIIPDMLLGAAFARAREICGNSFSRIYAIVDPEDQELMDKLAVFGFKDDDALVCMSLRLPCTAEFEIQTGCAVVMDDLSDPQEQQFFLKRYNEMNNTQNRLDWLDSFVDRPGFNRILITAQNGLMGEVLIWEEDGIGVIGYIQVARRWRRHGVASQLIGLACAEFQKRRLYSAEATVRARIPHIVRTFGKMGFIQTELLMRYPGIDINPVQPQNLEETEEEAEEEL